METTLCYQEFPKAGLVLDSDVYEKLGKTTLATPDRDQGKIADGELDPNVLTANCGATRSAP